MSLNRADDHHDDEGDVGFSFGSNAAYRRRGALDPEQLDIIDYGQARGHLNPGYARLIGMTRSYGFGASMSAWVMDTLQIGLGLMASLPEANRKRGVRR